MDWEKIRKQRQQQRRGSEEAMPRMKETPGPHTHIRRSPVRSWADMSQEEREEVRRSLGLSKGGKHRPSPS